MLDDLDHPYSDGEPVYDVTFENVQAGLRTDYLFRLANHRGGIVLGTGDLSELALGWCTYGVGDQMSHYAVNTGVPKTLIQHLIRWVIGTGQFDDEMGAVLREILDQEISPELVPVAEGERPQSTEDAIGPYALQDFTLFHVLRQGFPPSRIAFLARHAWADPDAGEWPPGFDADRRVAYDLATIRNWLEVFVQRFFAFSQFKRSALPERPQGASRRVAVAARRLAGTLGRERPGVAGRAAPQRPGGLMANPLIQRRMHRIVRRAGIRPQRALEVGGYVGANSLLRSKEIRRAERWCINLVEQPTDTGIRHVVGSSNDMHMFKDNSFDLVMSCAVHEHDQKFWLSIAEMHRVLRPGGLLVVCVPGLREAPRGPRRLDGDVPGALPLRLLPVQPAGRPRGVLRGLREGPGARRARPAADDRSRVQADQPPAGRGPGGTGPARAAPGPFTSQKHAGVTLTAVSRHRLRAHRPGTAGTTGQRPSIDREGGARMGKQEDFVLRALEERDVRFVRLWFTDVLGYLKSVAIAPAELEGAFSEGIGFDGSAIEGFARVYEADMLAKPDPSTFQILPWRGEGPSTARMFCDIVMPDGSPSYADPRYVLKRTLSKAAENGFTFYTHPEIEFYLFKDTPTPGGEPVPVDRSGLLRPHRAEHGLGLPPRGDHDARGDGHLGGVLPPRGRPGPAGDRPALRRRAVHGRQHHDVPHRGARGGAEPGHLGDVHAQAVHHAPRLRHAHARLAVRGRHATRSSRPARSTSSPRPAAPFIAGILTHAAEISVVTNQWVNSYKRLMWGGEAPSYICWGHNNRSAMIRVPMYKPNKGQSTRMELRTIDSAATPTSPSR